MSCIVFLITKRFSSKNDFNAKISLDNEKNFSFRYLLRVTYSFIGFTLRVSRSNNGFGCGSSRETES